MTTEIFTMPRQTFNRVANELIDRILLFYDYTIAVKRISLSEAALFGFTVTWAAWFAFRGPLIGEVFFLAAQTWAMMFFLLGACHIGSLFLTDVKARGGVVAVYAVTWCFFSILSIFAGRDIPALPTTIVLTILGVFIAIRLFRDPPIHISQA